MTSARIVVGITGGVAAFKMATVVSRLVQAGHHVDVVLSHGAQQFVGPATFAALCGRSPVTDTNDPRFPLGAHIELADRADALLIAPATARILAACAQGSADDLLATLYLACTCPVIMAPAMNNAMWAKPAVQRNVDQLQKDGVTIIGPESGWLSCRKQGAGRMSEPETLLAALEQVLPK
ncbi:MAG: flavoprotein [Pirellulales bacterium]